MEQGKKNKKSNTGKFILIGLGVVAVAGTAYYFATRKPKNNTDSITSFDPTNAIPSTTSSSSSSGSSRGNKSSGFPLKKGSRGDLVKNLQEALISKYGASILPKFGADGGFGGEMVKALTSKGFPTTIDADTFTKIVTSGGSSSGTPTKKKITPALVASNLRLAILDDDFSKANVWLSKMKSVKNYSAVSTHFKKKRIGGVRKTVVNALLTKFSKTSEKKKLNTHFHRMGLKFNGSQWSLSGLDQILCDQVKSIQNTTVWNASGKSIKVPKDTILGVLIEARNDMAKFKTLDGKVLFTNSKSIGYV